MKNLRKIRERQGLFQWQLEQVETFQEVIDWIGELKAPITKYKFLVKEYRTHESFIPGNEFLLSVKSNNYEDAELKVSNALPQDGRAFSITLREMVVE